MHKNVKFGFLQACINHGTLTLEMIKNILVPICDAYDCEAPVEPTALRNFVKELDSTITQFNQTLTFVKHPLVDEEFLVFGFISASSVSKLQSHYTDTDRFYFNKLLENLVNDEDYSMPWVEVYSFQHILPGQKPISKQHMQDLVQCWTKQGYFLEKDSKLYFGPRMLVEYSSHLKSHYPELVKDCPLCSELVLWDITCSECKIKLHRKCIRKYLNKKSTCPSCNKTWNTRLSL